MKTIKITVVIFAALALCTMVQAALAYGLRKAVGASEGDAGASSASGCGDCKGRCDDPGESPPRWMGQGLEQSV